MKRWSHVLLLAGVVAVATGCRTEIAPIVRKAPPKKVRAPGTCEVLDFPSASDLPAGAKNLGWVRVARLETDEATFEKLRAEVCSQGGDAMSQMHWLRPSGASVADTPHQLEGNAWVLP